MPMQFPPGGCQIREAKLIGGGACTRVCKLKVSIDYPHTEYDYSGLSLMDVSDVVVKVYPLCRV